MSNSKQDLEESFRLLDTNNSGIVERAELGNVLLQSGFSRDEAIKFINQVDSNKDGKINLEEFLRFFLANYN